MTGGGDKKVAYFRYEPIRWRVLENDGESLFLLADSVLDCSQYHRDDGTVTWATSYMRTWLNGYDGFSSDGLSFYTTAFTESERDAILITTITDSDNPLHEISGGADTEDKVFLLSINEALNEAYGFSSDVTSFDEAKRMSPSDYAFANGVWLGTYNELYYRNCWWLLRLPGSHQKAVSLIYPFGYVYQDGYYTDERYYGVCPAIKVSLDSDLWSVEYPETAYGDVDEDQSVDLTDAKSTLSLSLKLTKAGLSTQLLADVDGSGDVTLTDTRLILMYTLHLIDSFPVEETAPEELSASERSYDYEADELEWPTQVEAEATGTVWIAADSIAAYHSKSGEQPLYGWGELLGDYFDDNVTIQNQAYSGRSTKSFISESNYKTIMNNMQAGDYLLISFGHNDERGALSLYDDPYGDTSVRNSFKWLLKTYYIDPALEAGVTPILISPVVRRYYYKGTYLDPQLHSAYATAMEELVEEYAEHGITIGYIDLHTKMNELYRTLDEDGTLALHGLSGGVPDNTHLSKEGATIVCEYIIEGLKEQGFDICQFLSE